MKRILYLIIFPVLISTVMWGPVESFAHTVGDKAPLFSGESTQGKIQLANYLGKKNVVLALFFAAFTPV